MNGTQARAGPARGSAPGAGSVPAPWFGASFRRPGAAARGDRAARRLAAGLGLALCALALAGCDTPAPPPARPLRIALHSDPLGLDPHLHNEILTFSVLFNVYDGLTAFDPGLRVQPALAESWENPDELTWIFHLRRGVRFHDGRTCTSRDVVASLDRVRTNPQSQLASYFVEIAAARAIGPWTVELKTKKPLPVLLNKIASLAIVPADAPAAITQPIGTGAYRFADYQRGRRIALEAWPEHWGGAPAEAHVELLPVPDGEARVRQLLAGELDIAQDVPIGQLARVESAAGCRLLWRLGLGTEFLGLQPNRPPFADPRVREAIDVALDRHQLLAAAMAGHGQTLAQLVNENVHGYDPSIRVPERDLPRARRLLAEAGYAQGLDLTLELRQGRDGTAIRDQLAEVGVRVELVVRPWSEMYARLRASEVPFYFGGVVAPTADASDVLDSFAHTRQPERGYGLNNALGYSNPALDAAIEGSSATLDQRQRRLLLQRAIHLLADDRVYLALYAYSQFYGVRDGVDWEPRLNGFILARDVRRRRP